MSDHKSSAAKLSLAKGKRKLSTGNRDAQAARLSGSDKTVTKAATAVLRGTTDKVTPDGT